MKLKDIAEREKEGLKNLAMDNVFKIQAATSSIRKTQVKLYLSEKDKLRLLTLRVWSKKYKVSILQLLEILLPFWDQFLHKKVKRSYKPGLNVRISTLTGKKSEQILSEQLKKIYPNDEYKLIWLANKKEQIIRIRLKQLEKQYDDGVRSRSDPSSMRSEDTGKIMTLEDFSSPSKFIKYYQSYIRKENITRDKIQEEMEKFRFRNNPFIPEIC